MTLHLKPLALLLLASSVLHAQSAIFQAVSIHRNTSAGINTRISLSGGRLTIVNGSAKTLIRNAYDILGFQTAQEPRWLDAEMYDITATTGDGHSISQEELKPLLRNLLAERFQFKAHWEAREGQVYALLIDKSGPKLQPSASASEPSINTSKGPGAARMRGGKEPISILAGNLGNQLGRYVLDKTGLTGAYDWLLEWNPDPAVESNHPSLFTALQEQLGLRLEAQKGPIQTLVIDRVEKPSEN